MKLLKITALITITLTIGYLVHFYYNKKHQTTEIVEIYPDKAIRKIKPHITNNLAKNNDSFLYENLKPTTNHHLKITLLPEPEEPINIKSLTQTLPEEIDDHLNTIVSDIEDNNTEQKQSHFNIVRDDDNPIDIAIATKQYHHANNWYQIQLASVKTYNEAVSEWNRIKKSHNKILENVKVTFKKVDHENGKFFYLIIAGDYENVSQAKAVCKKLYLRQQNCIVAR